MPRRVNVKRLRERLAVSQPELARRLGVGLRSIQRWESATELIDPSPLATRELKRLMKTHGVTDSGKATPHTKAAAAPAEGDGARDGERGAPIRLRPHGVIPSLG